MKIVYSILFFLVLFTNVTAQEKELPRPYKSIDGIVNEVLEIVSREAGNQRDWPAFRNLFLPTARFTVLYHTDSIKVPVESINLDEFIEYMHDDYYNQGFLEYEVAKKVEEYNGLAQVFQTYYGIDSEGFEEMGINSYQLVYFADRWWIVSMVWTGDGNGVEVPRKYLKDK